MIRKNRRTYLTYTPVTLSKPWRWFWRILFLAAVVWISWGPDYSPCQTGGCSPPPKWFWKSHLLPRVP